jgi:hypothetical protein
VELAAALVQCCVLPAERHNLDAWPLLEAFLQAHLRTSELLGRPWTAGELRAIPDLIRYRELVVSFTGTVAGARAPAPPRPPRNNCNRRSNSMRGLLASQTGLSPCSCPLQPEPAGPALAYDTDLWPLSW